MDAKQKKRIVIIIIVGALIILGAWLYIQWLAAQPIPNGSSSPTAPPPPLVL